MATTNPSGVNSDKEHEVNKKRSNPNCLSKIFFCWVCPVLVTGNRRDVNESDLVVPNKKYDSDGVGEKFERAWHEELDRASLEKRNPSLWKAIVRTYWLSYMPGALYVFIMFALRLVQPTIFANLLRYWSVDSTMTQNEALIYAGVLLGINFVAAMCQHHQSLFFISFSMKLRIACSALLYRKVLRMSLTSVGDVAAGKLVNLLSNDVARFDYAFLFLHHIWLIPIQAAGVLYLMYMAVGYAPFVGLFGIVIIIFPLQATLTKCTAIIRRQVAQRTDRRIKLMGEIINGIQVIKMYAWEIPFQFVIKTVRAKEMQALVRSLFVRSMFLGFMMFTERSILFLTTLTMLLTGNMVTAAAIYPIQQYLSTIQINLTLILPLAVASLSELFVALERIQSFLMLDERNDLMLTSEGNNYKENIKFSSMEPDKDKDPSIIIPKKYSPSHDIEFVEPGRRPSMTHGDYAVELTGVSASWTNSNEDREMTLKNLTVRVRTGKLCAIIGPVGSGKSSLLQALLKELPVSAGHMKVNGRISYACQDPWLFSETVRENIIFGLPYDADKYKEVCRVCCLLPDFKQFPYGDLSLVGERGVSLSGGQRARINLARAVYRDADIYLLDDPLSAVDSNVGRLLFEGCINGYLRGRTCILVTHQVHFLKDADMIVVLNDGVLENVGTYNELSNSGQDFAKLLTNPNEESGQETEKTPKRHSMQREISHISVKSDDNAEDQQEQIQAEELRATGNLKWDVIYQYLKHVRSWCLVCSVLVALLVNQAAATGADYWLSYWTNNVNQYLLENGEIPDTALDYQVGLLTNAQYIGIYGGLILAIIVLLVIRILILVNTCMRASQNLHDSVFKNLLGAVMRFFDTNPSGRILNRFSKDLGAMDELLPRSYTETIQMYLTMISILTLNAIALPWTLIPTAILLVAFVVFLRWYLNAAQSVKRLEGTTKSPVFGMINSTITGLSTIRSSNSQETLLHKFDMAQDLYTSALYTFIGGSSTFGLYLDFLCLVYLTVILLIFVFIDFGDIIPIGSIGLAVSQSMILTMMLQMAARFTADFLAQMTSVERVLEYTKLPSERNMNSGPLETQSNWPDQGNVTFDNVFMRYGEENEPVLRGVKFEIKEGWKVGVVGRTGAGKSSLISALFRLYDLDGSIKIDGVDTGSIAKQELRSKISIIPQEPVLFSATIRYNLDPFDSYSDDDIWRALEQVELKEAVPALDYQVSEGGSNFSVGQRQLLCLARAMLRNNRVLVMDEATANVDPQTDKLIQTTIRRTFDKCTVITIAHRLNTIMDSDRVLVMDKGEAREFDYPYLLLSNPKSIFTFMVKETGESTSKQLYDIAKDKYLSDQKEA